MPLTTNQKTALFVGAVVVAAVVVGILYFNYSIRGQGRILSVEVKVFNDPGLLDPCLVIDFGDLYPGGEASGTVYIKNVGNLNLTLGIEAANWSPLKASVLVLNWDYYGQILAPGASMEAVLTLKVPQNISGFTDFTFDIIITSASVEPLV